MQVNDTRSLELRGDQALSSITDDEFGLTEAVTKLSEALSSRIHCDGYTLGIEGPWGSGKSTFANFVAHRLEQDPTHHVLRFEPWLISDKSTLAAFFAQLASKIDEIEATDPYGSSFTRWQRRRAARQLSTSMRRYGEYVAALSTPVGAVAAGDPTGTLALAAVGLKTVGVFARLLGKPLSLEKLKSQIVEGLLERSRAKPGVRFTVLIDDIDRLAPAEAVEILRMVQKVADFPAITYLICYDADVLSEHIKQCLQIRSGRDYAEKIFQDVMHLPPQEPFALRRSLRGKLERSFAVELARVVGDRDAEYRLELFFDRWVGEFVQTPRDVARLYDTIVLGWPCLPSGSDFCDFLWLQLIKLKSHKFYAWTRKYLQNVGAYRDGGRAGDTEPAEAAAALSEIMRAHGWEKRAYISGIDSFLPGVASFVFEGEGQRVFDFSKGELELFEVNQRLGSPSHWRQYFAFDAPSYALREADLAHFRKSCSEAAGKGARILRELFEREHQRRGHFVDLLLDRLIDLPAGSMSTKEADGLLSAFAATMDYFARESKDFSDFGQSNFWRKSCKLLEKVKPTNFREAIDSAKSINWLAYIVRDQGFAHGMPEGNREYPEHQWLAKPELDEAIVQIVDRFAALGLNGIFQLPSPQDVLFCWVQLGNADVVQQHFATIVQQDKGFLRALVALRGWANSSDVGITNPLYNRTVGYFLDAKGSRLRLEALSKDTGKKRAIRNKASELLKEWKSEGTS